MTRFTLTEHVAQRDDFAADVRAGLRASPKTLPPKYFYNDLGSALFEAICFLPEYYVSRCETEILSGGGAGIAATLGAPVRLIELGSGTSRKTRLLLDHLTRQQAALEYIPIDVDGYLLRQTAKALLENYPGLTVNAVVADFRSITGVLPPMLTDPAPRNVVLFLGSTIGNLDPQEQETLLLAIRGTLRPGDALFLGADRRKDRSILDPAYDDALGVTAAFNLNVLVRINAELGGHFDLSKFRHRAFFNETESRIEMHIVSTAAQRVAIDVLGIEIAFAAGETIHTENSYKFDDGALDALARRTGFEIAARWIDSRQFFADVLLLAGDTI
ncbi:MAG TPA: L-histidine N(alpha)-methyltransferase [Thermoanaerobaculia bacterium]|jgi:dimethylhistidine N-methyltransferase